MSGKVMAAPVSARGTERRAQIGMRRLSKSMRDYFLDGMGQSVSEIAQQAGMTHPTMGRIFYPERDGGTGVELHRWMMLLHMAGAMEPFLQGARAGVLQTHGVDRAPGLEIRPIEQDWQSPDELAQIVRSNLSQLGQIVRFGLTRLKVEDTARMTPNRLAKMMGVSHHTAKGLYYPEYHGAGAAVQRAFQVIDMAGGLGTGVQHVEAHMNRKLELLRDVDMEHRGHVPVLPEQDHEHEPALGIT